MKIMFAVAVAVISSAALAHDATVPHAHPHGASMFPDYAVALLIAALIAGAAIALRIWRKN